MDSNTKKFFTDQNAPVFKQKITVSEGRRVIGIPEEIDRALGKKENVDIWPEGNKIVAEIY
ncbi:MAG: hypothetical protein OIN88_15060 [Candidatus Methanoperedens sp.]|nr:hypothetical protein [Candidatus Methanoperedens sp.]MCZ7360375.1 hypothetical protein [Candidatus Methanoperedens sp.]